MLNEELSKNFWYIWWLMDDDNITDATFDYKKDFDGFYSKRK
jgi:hypothetical protein